MGDTAKNWPINRAPKRTRLYGDKSKVIESSQHIIEFPGGAVEVARCEDGSYWAHIIVNRGFGDGDGDGLTSAKGTIMETRVDYEDPNTGVLSISPPKPFTQVAVRIMPKKGL